MLPHHSNDERQLANSLRNVRGDQLQFLFKVFTSVLDSSLFTTCQSQLCVTVAYPTLVCLCSRLLVTA